MPNNIDPSQRKIAAVTSLILVVACLFMYQNCGPRSNSSGSSGGSGSSSSLSGSGVAHLYAGFGRSCYLQSSGNILCWGRNENGELGSTVSGNATSPAQVAGVTGASQLAIGMDHICALISGGVQCWGANLYGQLGNNSNVASTTPVVVVDNAGNPLSGVTEVVSGNQFSCALVNGFVACWGFNTSGQLGNASNVSSPVAVYAVDSGNVPLSNISSLVAGGAHVCALSSSAGVNCWGANSSGQLGNNSTLRSTSAVSVTLSQGAQSLAAGSTYTCAVLNNGQVSCWGSNAFGQLGQADSLSLSSVPVSITGLNSVQAVIAGGGSNHVCALLKNGGVSCWGSNAYGQLGNNSDQNSFTPVAVQGLSAVASLALGASHTCALQTNGQVSCWGQDSFGQLGDANSGLLSLTPVLVPGMTSVSALSIGSDDHACASGLPHFSCWGANSYGQLGTGSTSYSTTPLDNSASAKVIATGGAHTCVVEPSNGQIQCWGNNQFGEVGTAPDPAIALNYVTTPTLVPGISGASTVVTGGFHSCALVGGSVLCWGNNAQGQLGNGTDINSDSPKPVPGLGSVTAIAAGTYHTCALNVAGAVKCWGSNSYGQLGNNTITNSNLPVHVSGLSAVTSIASGGLYNCAVSGGKVSCWGYNYLGQLGNAPSTTNSLIPIAVNGPTNVLHISLSSNHACSLSSGHVLKCWGDNFYGQLGHASPGASTTATKVTVFSGPISRVVTGSGSTCVISSQQIQCWGWNGGGVFGNGVSVAQWLPVPVAL